MVPLPYRTQGIIDTAAQDTCIAVSIADTLRLDPVRYVPLHTASGEKPSAVYHLTVQLGWSDDHPSDPIPVFAHEAVVTGAEMLVGLDVLRKGRFALDGPNDRYELFLPRAAESHSQRA